MKNSFFSKMEKSKVRYIEESKDRNMKKSIIDFKIFLLIIDFKIKISNI